MKILLYAAAAATMLLFTASGYVLRAALIQDRLMAKHKEWVERENGYEKY